jgi:orotidine-5'-phosphate decarboxylase
MLTNYSFLPAIFQALNNTGNKSKLSQDTRRPNAARPPFLFLGKEKTVEERIKEAARRIILPLDFASLGEAIMVVSQTRGLIQEYKIGLEAITDGYAHPLCSALYDLGLKVGWDGKWDDIGETIKRASKALLKKGKVIKWCNVHASAGEKSIEAAMSVCSPFGLEQVKVYGVTVLTSIDPEECKSIFGDYPGPKVLQFTEMLNEKKASGIICSPQELQLLAKTASLNRLIKVTPGVRPDWAEQNDQKRTLTPFEAIVDGADYLVIGRPITRPPEHIGSVENAVISIATEMADAIEIRKSHGTWKEAA